MKNGKPGPGPTKMDLSIEIQSKPYAEAASHLVTKHSWHGSYPRLLELTRVGLETREPESNRCTNSWLFSDVLCVAAVGEQLTLTMLKKNHNNSVLCCLSNHIKLLCSFESVQAAAVACRNIEHALMHGYDASTGWRHAHGGTSRVSLVEPPASASARAAPSAASATSRTNPAQPGRRGGGGSAGAEAAEEDEFEVLQKVLDGTRCLAGGGPHLWRTYDGNRGSGRCCERCFMCQDQQCNVLWRVSPALPEEVRESVRERARVAARPPPARPRVAPRVPTTHSSARPPLPIAQRLSLTTPLTPSVPRHALAAAGVANGRVARGARGVACRASARRARRPLPVAALSTSCPSPPFPRSPQPRLTLTALTCERSLSLSA